MTFVPSMDIWLKSHFVDVPEKLTTACGNLSGKRILSVGCGEMLIELGLLTRGPSEVVGLDIIPQEPLPAAAKLLAAGYPVPKDYANRSRCVTYDGTNFPFEDDSFDVVFSWGAFEHVRDVSAVLREMRRVMRPNGVGYISVFPWFPSFHGGHLTDYINEPFFHLRKGPQWISDQLEGYAEKNPAERDFVTRHMRREFDHLNRLSADDFYRLFRQVGFREHTWEALCYPVDLTLAPRDRSFGDLMIAGSSVAFRK